MTDKSNAPRPLAPGSYDFQKLRKGDFEAARQDTEQPDRPQGARPDQKLVERENEALGHTEEVLVHDKDSEAAKAGQVPERQVSMSIPKLKEHLATITDRAQITALREAEAGGDNRDGALAVIDARDEELASTSTRQASQKTTTDSK